MQGMDNLERELQAWRETAPVDAAPGSIGKAVGFQPRDLASVPPGKRVAVELELDRHVARMRATLEGNPLVQLDPLLVATIDGRRFVVDGHHRLKAYRLAKRFTVPIRERTMTAQHAALLSRLVNLDGVKLPMTADQCREAAWQYLAHVTGRGRFTLQACGLSKRTVAAKFGNIGRETVANMVRRMEATKAAVDGNEFPAPALDPASRWPLWRYARGESKAAWDAADPSARYQQQVEQCAAKIGALRSKHGPEVFQRAIAMLRDEGMDDDAANAD
jgi:hypothetical protein